MNQELENNIFNLKMNELLSSIQRNPTNKKRSFFLDSDSFGIGAKVYNDDFYFYDLTYKHSEEPLGFNHPLILRDNKIPNHCHHAFLISESIESIQRIFEDALSLSLGFKLVEQTSIYPDSKNSFLIDENFFKHPRHIERLKQSLPGLEFLFIRVNSDLVLFGQVQLDEAEEFLPSKSSHASADLQLLKRKLKFYIESNLLSTTGKLASLNKKFEEFSNLNSRMSYGDLSLVSVLENSVVASKSQEQLKSKGVLVDLEGSKLLIYFPLTILDEELVEILGILKECLI